MNALMNITVRVQAARAQAEVDRLRARIAELEAQIGQTNAAASRLASGGLDGIAKWGSQTQWAGRQLFHNFTVPLMLAGGAATHWALENERAMIRVRKVYGDSSTETQQLKDDMNTLSQAADFMSVRFGVAREEVLGIAADWAAAGATGQALGMAMDATLTTMVIGEMNAQQATEALIATQAQYGTNLEGLRKIIDALNITENETGITLSGLIEGFQRAAGVARSSGVDYQHLAAMLAAISPAAGSAAQAGNGLKTIISRIMSPTKEAARQMEALGINVNGAAWQGMNATQRIERLALAVDQLGGEADGLISSKGIDILTDLGSRWQVNRLDVLFRDIAASMNGGTEAAGYYGKTLEALNDEYEVFKRSQRELNTVLESSPVAFDRAGVVIKNSLMKVVTNILPQILWFVQSLAKLTQKFSEMHPALQKLIIGFFGFLAVLGPPLMIMGAFAVAIGRIGQVMQWVTSPLSGFFGAFKKGEAATAASAAATKKAAGTIAGSAGQINAATGSTATSAQTAAAASASAARTSSAAWTGFSNVMSGVAAAVNGLFQSMVGFVMGYTDATGVAGETTRVYSARMASSFTAATSTMAGAAASAGAAIPTAFGTALAETTAYATWTGTYFASTFPTIFGTAVAGAYTAGVNTGLAFLRGFQFTWAQLWAAIMEYFGVFTAQITAGSAPTAGAGYATGARVGSAVVAGFSWTWAELWAAIMAYFGVFTAQITAGSAGPTAAAYLAGARVGGAFNAGFVTMTPLMIGSAAATGTAVGTTLGITAGASTSRGFFVGITAFFKRIPALLAKLWPALLIGLKKFGPMLLKFFTGPIGWAVTAAIAILTIFQDQVRQFVNNVIDAFHEPPEGFKQAWQAMVALWNKGVEALHRAFNSLPQGIQDAMKRVVEIVRSAALAVYDFFSYINPFAHHSPSLVENVTAGMAVVGDQFGLAAGRIKKYMLDSYGVISRFGKATAGLNLRADENKRNEERGLLRQHGGNEAVAAYDALQATLAGLRRESDAVKAAIDRQKAAVDAAERSLNNYRKAADAANDVLQELRDKAQDLENAISDANSVISDLGGRSIKGMRAMEDAIFQNEMAQKRLNLELLKMGDGVDYDELRSRVASLQGEIERLRGTQNDLRAAGADSSVLSFYDDQIKALEAQQKQIEDTQDPVEDLKKQLKELERQGQIMDLEKALKFDPLKKQIEDLIDTSEELTFDQIIKGIKEQQQKLPPLERELGKVNDQIARQEKVVDAANAKVKAASDAYDAQRDILGNLQDVYDGINERIGAMEEALQLSLSSAQELTRAMEEAARAAEKLAKAKKDKAGKGGDPIPADGFFADPGGIPTFEDGDFQAWLDQYMAEMGNMFDGLDMWAPIREAWNKFLEWWNTNVTPIWDGLKSGFGELFEGITWEGILQSSGLADLGTRLGEWWQTNVLDNIPSMNWGAWWDEFSSDFMEQATQAWEGIKEVWNKNIPDLSESFSGLRESLMNLWNAIEPALGPILTGIGAILGGIGASALLAINTVIAVVGNLLGTILDTVMGVVGSIIQIFSGIINIISGIINTVVGLIRGFITGDFSQMWQGLGQIGQGIIDVVGGIISGIWSIISGIAGAIWDIGVGIVEGFQNTFNQIAALLGMDQRLNITGWFEDVYNGVVEWIGKVPGAVAGFFQDMWDRVTQIAYDLWDYLLGHSIFPDIYNGIIEWLTGLPSAVADFFLDMKDRAIAKVTEWYNSLLGSSGWIPTTWNGIVDWFKQLPGKIEEFFNDAKDKAINKLAEWYLKILGPNGWIPNTWNGIIDWFKQLPGKVEGFFTDTKDKAITKITEWYNGLLANPTGWIPKTYNGIIDWLKNIPTKVADFFHDAWQQVKQKAMNIYLDIAGPNSKFYEIYTGVVGWVRKMRDDLGSAWNEIKAKFAEPINWVIRTVWNKGVVETFNAATKALGINKSMNPIPEIQTRAKGGYTPPGMTLVGEEGPELVNFRSPAMVYTAAQTQAIMRAQQGLDVTEEQSQAMGAIPFKKNPLPIGGWFTDGVRAIGSGVADVWKTAGEFIRGGLAKAAETVVNPLRSIIRATPLTGKMGEFGKDFANKGLDEIITWVRGKDKEFPAVTEGGEYMGPFSSGWMRPSRGPITSRWGAPRGTYPHAGIDIAGGGPTYAAKSGAVVKTGWNIITGRSGIGILLSHGNKEWTYYGHNPVGGVQVKAGQTVKQGQHIGYQGATGNVTGTHLHFEYHRGRIGGAINPAALGVFDNGGWLEPGALALNQSRNPEPVFNSSQWGTLATLIDTLGNFRFDSVDRLITRVEALAAEFDTGSTEGGAGIIDNSVTVTHGDTHIHIHGNLEFPNIRSGEDAEAFVRNLETLAG